MYINHPQFATCSAAFKPSNTVLLLFYLSVDSSTPSGKVLPFSSRTRIRTPCLRACSNCLTAVWQIKLPVMFLTMWCVDDIAACLFAFLYLKPAHEIWLRMIPFMLNCCSSEAYSRRTIYNISNRLFISENTINHTPKKQRYPCHVDHTSKGLLHSRLKLFISRGEVFTHDGSLEHIHPSFTRTRTRYVFWKKHMKSSMRIRRCPRSRGSVAVADRPWINTIL